MEQDLCTHARAVVQRGRGDDVPVVSRQPNAEHFRFNRATLLLLSRPPSLTWARWCELQGVCFEVVNHHCTDGGAQRTAVAEALRHGFDGAVGGGPLDAPTQCRGNVRVLMGSLVGYVSFGQGGRVV